MRRCKSIRMGITFITAHLLRPLFPFSAQLVSCLLFRPCNPSLYGLTRSLSYSLASRSVAGMIFAPRGQAVWSQCNADAPHPCAGHQSRGGESVCEPGPRVCRGSVLYWEHQRRAVPLTTSFIWGRHFCRSAFRNLVREKQHMRPVPVLSTRN